MKKKFFLIMLIMFLVVPQQKTEAFIPLPLNDLIIVCYVGLGTIVLVGATIVVLQYMVQYIYIRKLKHQFNIG